MASHQMRWPSLRVCGVVEFSLFRYLLTCSYRLSMCIAQGWMFVIIAVKQGEAYLRALRANVSLECPSQINFPTSSIRTSEMLKKYTFSSLWKWYRGSFNRGCGVIPVVERLFTASPLALFHIQLGGNVDSQDNLIVFPSKTVTILSALTVCLVDDAIGTKREGNQKRSKHSDIFLSVLRRQ